MPDLGSLPFIAAVFAIAGWIKGVVGMGLPTFAMGALGLVMAPIQAAGLLLLPSLVTNVWQFVAGPARLQVIRRFAMMMAFICLGTALGIGLLTAGSSRWPAMALGAVLVTYALLAFALPALTMPSRWEPIASPLVGAVTGALSGATGVFVVPAVPYLSALGLNKEELIQALGLSFTISTLALALAMGLSDALSPRTLGGSLAAVMPALLGMFAGQRMRHRIDAARFKRWFFAAMLLIGSYMMIRGLLAT